MKYIFFYTLAINTFSRLGFLNYCLRLYKVSLHIIFPWNLLFCFFVRTLLNMPITSVSHILFHLTNIYRSIIVCQALFYFTHINSLIFLITVWICGDYYPHFQMKKWKQGMFSKLSRSHSQQIIEQHLKLQERNCFEIFIWKHCSP